MIKEERFLCIMNSTGKFLKVNQGSGFNYFTWVEHPCDAHKITVNVGQDWPEVHEPTHYFGGGRSVIDNWGKELEHCQVVKIHAILDAKFVVSV